MHRRRFLHLTSTGLAASAALPLVQGCGKAGNRFRLWTWVRGGGTPKEGSWEAHFGRLAEAGFFGVLVGGGDGAALARAANAAGLECHRWIWALNRNGDDRVKADHPEWFAVSREGKSSLTDPPYVGYYRWVCPRRRAVRDYLRVVARETAAIPGIAGVHLDYIRYPDVILPKALWAKYGLVQTTELPPYDFCYCDVCRASFEDRTGTDPLALADPPSDRAWREFRWESVTLAVTAMAEEVHGAGKPISAAVFPTPVIARRLVRQAWDTWPLDLVFPMIYHGFYEEPVAWIGDATREDVAAVPATRPIMSGLSLPDLPPADLTRAIALARDAGASGVSLFDSGALDDARLAAVRAAVASW